MTRVIFGAGGTGGHVFMAVGIAQQLALETVLVTDLRGVKYHNHCFNRVEVLPISSGRFNLNLIKSFFRLFKLFKEQDAIFFGCGAYTSLITGLVAILCRVPIFIYQGDQQTGRANRFLQRFAKVCFTSTDELSKYLKNSKTVGLISRKDIRAYPISKYGFNLLILGSSTGSVFFAELIPKLLAEIPLGLRKKIHVIQQKNTNLENLYSKLGVSYELHQFIDTVTALPKSHLVIARAGCGTLADLINAKRAGILIPWKGALDNHQELNAVRMGAGWSFPEPVELQKLTQFVKFLMLDFFEKGYDESELKKRAEYLEAPSADGGKQIARYLDQYYH